MPNNNGNEPKVGLREYLESLIKGLQKNNDDKFIALEQARELAFNNLEKRLDGMNEIRDQLREQATTFVQKVECNPTKDRFAEDIRILTASKNILEGKASQKSVNMAIFIAFTGLVMSIVGIIIAILK